MYVNHDEITWMLRQINGQRGSKAKLIEKFANHGISSLLPYYPGIDSIFEQLDDRLAPLKSAVLDLELKINHKLPLPADISKSSTLQEIAQQLTPLLIQHLKNENFTTLDQGARVKVRLDSQASNVKPGSEGFIREKLSGAAKVKFYAGVGRNNLHMPAIEVADEELEVISVQALLARHQDFSGIAQYFLHDSLLKAMRAHIDSSVYAFAAELAVKYLAEEGYLKIVGNEFISEPEPIFSFLAPKMDKTYKDASLFTTHNLSCPPSERKPHVLRLELTTGCDYNKCTFCSEYTGMAPVTKSFAEFKEHIGKVIDSIGSEKSRVQRIFIGSGNSLGIETELLLESLNYVSDYFNPQRISLYGRTVSILEKSVDQLKKLKEAGLTLIYWGLESGSDEILSYICKDCTRNDMVEASKMLVEAGIETSGMLMPGVGGLKYAEEHVTGTLELLHGIELNYLTLLSINPAETSAYTRNMQAETDNRPLTPEEVNAQIYKLLGGLQSTGLQIGMFTEEIDQASSNTKRFNYQFTEANKELLLRDFWN